LSSDHLLSGVIAEYYTTNSGSSGGIGKGNRGRVSGFRVSKFHYPTFSAGSSVGFPLCPLWLKLLTFETLKL
jgi:hypothetical protein